MIAEADLRQERVLKEKNAIIQMKVKFYHQITQSPQLLSIYINIILYLLKDDEIKELKDKMDQMAEEFGDMLRVISLYEDFIHLLFNYFPSFYSNRKPWRKCVKESKYQAIIMMDQTFKFNKEWKKLKFLKNNSSSSNRISHSVFFFITTVTI